MSGVTDEEFQNLKNKVDKLQQEIKTLREDLTCPVCGIINGHKGWCDNQYLIHRN